MNDNYDDIINLPHHVSRWHKPMPQEERAAQFAPFAALTGYDAAIQEAARLTFSQLSLDVDASELLDRKLAILREHIARRPQVTITYFSPDDKKAGGQYRSVTGQLKKIDDYAHSLTLGRNLVIPMQHVLDITSPLLDDELD